MDNNREQILALHNLGWKHVQISKELGIPRSTVSYSIKRYKETGRNQNRPKSGRKRTVTSSYNIKRVKQAIKRKKTHSARNLAKRLNIGRKSVRRILKNHLALIPYKKKRVQLLKDATVKKRLERCRKFKRRFSKHAAGIIFTDEKLFTIQQTHNNQNDRVWAQKGYNGPELRITRTPGPSSVMVWAGITRDGKTPLIFIDKGVKINKEVYKEMLEDKVIPWSKTHFGNQYWTFQQDSAHKAKVVQQFLAENCPDYITSNEWPPSSPDLNPMDYAIWSILEKNVCVKNYRSVDALKRKLKSEWDKLDLETVRKSYDDWWRRIDCCIKAKSGHFE